MQALMFGPVDEKDLSEEALKCCEFDNPMRSEGPEEQAASGPAAFKHTTLDICC